MARRFKPGRGTTKQTTTRLEAELPDIIPTKTTIGGRPITAAGEAERRINVLIYGDSGIGKTVLAGSAAAVPEMRDVLVLDAEGGTESLVRTYPQCDAVRITKTCTHTSIQGGCATTGPSILDAGYFYIKSWVIQNVKRWVNPIN